MTTKRTFRLLGKADRFKSYRHNRVAKNATTILRTTPIRMYRSPHAITNRKMLPPCAPSARRMPSRASAA
jgi:hypothetical protein